MAQRTRRKRLGEILVAHGVLTQEQLDDALSQQSDRESRQRLGRTIVELGLSTETDIASALADQLNLATVDLTEVGPDGPALARVPRKLAERHGVLPLRLEHDVLEVAMSDPTNVVALDDIKLASRARAVRPVVATESQLEDALRRAYGSDQAALDMVDALADGDVVSVDDDFELGDDSGVDDQPIIRLANAILADAVRTRASDVHVEPEREHVRVRYRIDGLLRETMRVPKHIGPSLTSRLKIMSTLDIAERRRPQDGRAMIRVEGQEVDLRVSTMPTMFGETVVLRLLRKGSARLELEDLGLPPDLREVFESTLFRPQGLIVITGPTGSGKTTSLYAGLTELADPVRNVITLEDPIEYQLSGINQTQINPKIDLTFARGLRTVLRQDPDVVMVGEIRDRETAELAMEASFTGHLVLSTLHTNDSVSTIVRLVDLGVENFLIASALLLVVAQRLARVVCDNCKEPTEPDPKVLRQLGLTMEDVEGKTLMAGKGCQVCDQTGYLGRVGVYEMLEITPAMRELITAGGTETQLATMAARQGMRSLRQDGIAKAFAGITTLDEVLRTTPEPTVGVRPSATPVYDPADLVVAPVEKTMPAPVPAPNVDDAPAPPVEVALGDREPAHEHEDEDERFDLVFDAETGQARGGTILVVEDDSSVRQLLGVLLDEDWVVLEAEDGETAIKMQNKHRPDLILLDQHLPDITGIEVTRRIREGDGRRHVPIIMVTGDRDSAVEVEGLLAGVDDFLSKPFEGEVLAARMSAVLRRKFRV